MSVENLADPDGIATAMLEEQGDIEQCFYCFMPLGKVVVFWSGPGRKLALHPECGVHFGGHLIKDGLNAKAVENGVPADATVAPSLRPASRRSNRR